MLGGKTLAAGVAAFVVLAGVGGYGGYRVWRHLQGTATPPAPRTAVVIGAPTTPPTGAPAASPTPVPAATPLPASVLVRVPFTSQAPSANWDTAHEEYCEAAALLMVSQYFKGDARSRIPPSEADADMGRIVATERKDFPGVLDLPLADIGTVGTQLFGLTPAVVPLDEAVARQDLAQGLPVIVPVMTHGLNGQAISPHYSPGDVYHVILVIGYDTGKGMYYANDAGFMEGQNWPYTWSTLSIANVAQTHKVPQGQVMLVFRR